MSSTSGLGTPWLSDEMSLTMRSRPVAAVAVQALLDPTAALAESVAGEAHDMEGVHHRGRVGGLLGGRGLEPGEPVHRHYLHAVPEPLGTIGQPLLECRLGAALHHVQQPCWTGAFTN